MDFSIFKDVKATNWRQQNGLDCMFKDGGRDFNRKKGEVPEGAEILDILSKINDGKDIEHRFYFEKPLPLGKVLHYNNAELISVEYNDSHLVFHIRFDIENPFIEEINKLKAEIESYNGMTKEEFSTARDRWNETYDKMRNLDAFIPDSTYAYSYDIKRIGDVLAEMRKAESIKFAKTTVKMIKAIRRLRTSSNFDNMSFEVRKEYWRMNDRYNDLVNGRIPTAEQLEQREKQYSQSEEEYNNKNEYMMDLLKEVIQEKRENEMMDKPKI